MEYTFRLPNGRKFKSDEVKCPICGHIMNIKKGDVTMPKVELDFRSCEPPFTGTMIDKKTYTNITMECPNECCTLDFTDCDTEYCVGSLNV